MNFLLRIGSLFLLLLSFIALPAQCPSGHVELNTQLEVNDFAAQYPNCTTITGNLIIDDDGSDNITDLSPLSNLQYITGRLEVKNTPSLQSLFGLHNIVSVGHNLRILTNASLLHLELSSLNSVSGFLAINYNSVLESMEGLDSLVSIDGAMVIRANPLLRDISALSSIDPDGIQSMDVNVDDYEIHDNTSLSYCAINSVCAGIADSLHTFDVRDNKPGCNSVSEIEAYCFSTPWDSTYCLDTAYGLAINPVHQRIPVNFGGESAIGRDWVAVSGVTAYPDGYPDFPELGIDVYFYTKEDTGYRMNYIFRDMGSQDIYATAGDVVDMSSFEDRVIVGEFTVDRIYGPLARVLIFTQNIVNPSWQYQQIFVDEECWDYPYCLEMRVDIDSVHAVVGLREDILYYHYNGSDWVNIAEFQALRGGKSVGIFQDQIIVSTDSTVDVYQDNTGNNDWGFQYSIQDGNQVNARGKIKVQGNKLIAYQDSDLEIYTFDNNSWVHDTSLLSLACEINDADIYDNRLIFAEQQGLSFYQRSGSEWLYQDFFRNYGTSCALYENHFVRTKEINGIGVFPTPFGEAPVVGCIDVVCPDGNVTFTRQSQIDSFPILYPYCDVISGNLLIQEESPGAITDLTSLSTIVSVIGRLEVRDNANLISLHGLHNVESIGSNLRILTNDALTEFDLASLIEVGGFLALNYNNSVVSFSGLEGLSQIGGSLVCRANPNLMDIGALANIDESSIQSIDTQVEDIEIHDNTSLSYCSIYPVCEAISNGQHTFEIRDNAAGCNSVLDVDENCQPVIEGADCPQILNVQSVNMDGRYRADQFLISNTTIPSSRIIIFESGEIIELGPGFEVLIGAEFKAKIQECIPQ